MRALQLPSSKEMSSLHCYLYRRQECKLTRGYQGRRVDVQETMHQTCAQIWDVIKASLSGSGPETCQAAQAAAALHGLTATSNLQLSRTIQAALQELSRTCRYDAHVHCYACTAQSYPCAWCIRDRIRSAPFWRPSHPFSPFYC